MTTWHTHHQRAKRAERRRVEARGRMSYFDMMQDFIDDVRLHVEGGDFDVVREELARRFPAYALGAALFRPNNPEMFLVRLAAPYDHEDIKT